MENPFALKVHNYGGDSPIIMIVNKTGKEIAQVFPDNNQQGIATLFASAPDLFAANYKIRKQNSDLLGLLLTIEDYPFPDTSSEGLIKAIIEMKNKVTATLDPLREEYKL